MDILQVVSRVRRHFRRPARRRSRQQQQQQQQQLAPQPPDLRRWSDFENPFPSVSPGGYRRYYQTHAGPGPSPRVSIAPAPAVSSSSADPGELAKRPRRHGEEDTPYGHICPPAPVDNPLRKPGSASPSPSISTSPPNWPPLSSGSTRHGKGKNRQGGLGTMLERDRRTKTPAVYTAQPARLHPTPSTSSTETPCRLRRRRRRLLRTPSVIRDFAGWGAGSVVMSTLDSLDGEGLMSESSESHWTDTPATTVEGHEFDEEVAERLKGMYLRTSHTERSESRNSFHSARSRMSDYE